MKKLISCVLALVLALSLVPSAFAAEGASVDKFTDVPADAWYRDELAYALHNGYISGTSETTFAPDALVTRGQFVTIMGRMLGADMSNGKTQFTDVPEKAFYAPYVGWAASKGYVNGTSATTFAPDANITFEQMGTIIANHLNKSGVVVVATLPPTTYKDASSIAGWAKGSMELMAKYNLLPTDAAGNVNPRNQVTRAEAAVALVRLARGIGLGVVPTSVYVDAYDVQVAAKVKEVHDELWASGKITFNSTEKEKAIAYFRWMCENTSYGANVADVFREFDDIELEYHNAYGPLILGKGVCDGIANAYYQLLKAEGIACDVVISVDEPGVYVSPNNHAWNTVVLDGDYFECIDLTEGISSSKNANGTLNESAFETNVQKQFYPDEYQKQFEGGFGGPLSEEELQKMLEGMQNEYNASRNQ